MASPTGSITTSQTSRSGSDGSSDLQQLMDQRKRKRMVSNRESARRSRMRKQKHLDELSNQLNQLRDENGRILSALTLTTQFYLNLEAENSVLRAQMAELSSRLESLNEIIIKVNYSHCNNLNMGGTQIGDDESFMATMTNNMNSPWNPAFLTNPLIAATDILMY